jgi:hypothetical protein
VIALSASQQRAILDRVAKGVAKEALERMERMGRHGEMGADGRSIEIDEGGAAEEMGTVEIDPKPWLRTVFEGD